MAFSELIARSNFSFLRGASSPEELLHRAQALKLSSLGLCDHNGLYGAVRAWVAAKELGQKLHFGASISLTTDATATFTLCALPHDALGYQNLCQLLTQAHSRGIKGEAWLRLSDFSEQSSQSLSLIVPVFLDSEITSSEATSDEARSSAILSLSHLSQLFRNRGYIACYRRLDGFDPERMAQAERLSRTTGFPVIASNFPLYHERSRRPLADIVQCIREGYTLDQAGTRLSSNAEACLRSEQVMRRLFQERPSWVDNTELAAAALQFDLKDLRYQFPCALDEGETADEKLRRLTWEGAARRYSEDIPERVVLQLEKELKLITRLGVASYFLCTWEIIEIARTKHILCQGRGSAANSAVCFVLGITAVDPARSNLLFERFLSEERAEPPDIDIDFEHERREEVIQAIYDRYGRDRAAMVSTVICYRGKSALREVGKVFGLSNNQVNQLSSSITHWNSAESSTEHFRQHGLDVNDHGLRQVVEWSKALEGTPRHMSIHVGGFVLSQAPLCQIAPVEPASMPGRTVIPWDKDDIDALGFFKVDVLGLGMLTAIRKALRLTWNDGYLRGTHLLTSPSATADFFDPLEVVTRVPPEDRAVYGMISEADTVGVFQVESRAQMAMLPRLRPQHFYDLVVEVALVRPGPIQGGMVHPYLKRRNGEEPIHVPHECLWPILQRTLGVPLFQEQVMQLAIAGAGYTGGEADQLRRDMAAWKRTGQLNRHRERLISGFKRKGISESFGTALFEQIKGFGEYGFPESHAASFALLVYLSAWLKAHFPAYFTCALVNSQPLGFYSVSSLLKDAQRHGVTILPVDVCHSDWDCTLEGPVEKRAVRLGLRLIKGLNSAQTQHWIVARNERQFQHLADFRTRSGLATRQLELLAEAGALEGLQLGRRQALWAVGIESPGPLFRNAPSTTTPANLPPLAKGEQMALDYQRLGLCLSDHPLSHLRARLAQQGVIRASQLSHAPGNAQVRVAGLVLARQRPSTASGIVFITLEDETGTINVVLFRQLFEQYHHVARHAMMLLVVGKLERKMPRPKPGEVGRPTAIIHVIAQQLARLDTPQSPQLRSRDFH